MAAVSAAHRRAADSTSVSSTVCKIECRAADHLENVGGGGLLLQGFPQLVEETCILDGDNSLFGEGLDKRALLFRKTVAGVWMSEINRPNALVLANQRHEHN